MPDDLLSADFFMRPFTEAFFNSMAVLIPQMSITDQEQIRAYLCKPKKHNISSLMTRMIAMSPMLAKEFKDQPFEPLRLTLGPLLFWGLTQPWAKECNVPICLQAWRARLTDSTHPTNLSMAILGLGVLPLVGLDSLQLDRAGKERLCGDIYRTMQAMVPWENQTSTNDMVLAPLLQLALSSPSEKVGNASLRAHWKKCMRLTMSMSSALDQKHCIQSLMASGLEGKILLATFKATDPLVWLMPEFRQALLDILPKHEAARTRALTWTPNTWRSPAGGAIRPGEVNRMLYEKYCPLLYLGLAMVTQKVDDWEDRAYIKLFVDEFSTPENLEKFALPDDLLAETPH